MKLAFFTAVLLFSILGYISVSRAGTLPKIGVKAPNFNLPDAKGTQHSLSSYAGKWLVLYFYPKDDTPGCTKEACHFRDDLTQLEKLGAQVVGVSVDDGKTHRAFTKKYNLPFALLSDKSGTVADSYGALTNLLVMKLAKRYTFLIDPEGNIAKVYLSVDTSKHSQEIIEDLVKLSK